MSLSTRFIHLCLAAPLALVAFASAIRAQQVTIAPQFESAGSFHKGVAPAQLDKLWGLIDRTGAWVVRPRYANMRRGGDGLFPVESDGAWGFIDAKGQPAIAAKYEDAMPFENGTAAVKEKSRWGYVRADGSTETDFLFLEIGGREGAYVSARGSEGWAVFWLAGQGSPKRVAFNGDKPAQRAFSISENTVIARFADGEQLLQIVPYQYQISDDPTAGKEQGFNLEDRGGDRRYVSIRRMSEGFAAAATAADKWGYLHKGSGALVWAGRFQDAFEFSQGFAPVKLGGRWGYIDRAARVVVQPAYDAAFPFRGGYAVYREGNKRGFLRLDPQGGIAPFVTPQYDDAFRFTEGLAPVKVGERWGYVSDGQPWRELTETGVTEIQPR